jgi:hypothetical protein
VGEVVFGFRTLLHLGLQVALDLGVADRDAVVDVPLARAGDEQLVADGGAHAVEALAFLFQRGRKTGHVELVLRGDALQRALDLGRVDADAGAAGVLLQRQFGDHAFEQLFFQHLARWQRRVLPRQVLHHLGVAPGQFLAGDDFVVDDGDDVVERQDCGVRRQQGRGGDQQRRHPVRAAPFRAFQ